MTNSPRSQPRPSKLCFLTTGATAPFHSLLRSALSPPFLCALAANDYTDLLLQHGQGGSQVLESIVPAEPDGDRSAHGVHVAGFDFRTDGLVEEMRAAKGGGPGGLQEEGCVVCHAGTLEVLCMQTNEGCTRLTC